MVNPDEGATPTATPVDPCITDPVTGRVNLKHFWVWVYEGGKWTDNVRCTTCNKIRLNVRNISGEPL